MVFEPKEAVRFGHSEFLLAHLGFVLSTKSGIETRYNQYAAVEIDN